MIANNGNLTDVDRTIIQNEYNGLLSNLINISNQTQWNTQKLVEGTTKLNMFDGTVSSNLNLYSNLPFSINLDSVDLINNVSNSISIIDNCIEIVSCNRNNVGVLFNRYGHSISIHEIESYNIQNSIYRIEDLDVVKETTNLK